MHAMTAISATRRKTTLTNWKNSRKSPACLSNSRQVSNSGPPAYSFSIDDNTGSLLNYYTYAWREAGGDVGPDARSYEDFIGLQTVKGRLASSVDRNGDGAIGYRTEFIPFIKEILKNYAGDDDYISNGQGRTLLGRKENPRNELQEFIDRSGLSFDQKAVANWTRWGKTGYSFSLDERTPFSYYEFAWKSFGGQLSLKEEYQLHRRTALAMPGTWIKA